MKPKGVYPHDYMSSFDKFNNIQLVTKDEFYSILSDEHISDDQCKHVQNVWNTSNLKTMGDYHDFHKLDPAIVLQVLDCLGMIQYVKNDRYKIRTFFYLLMYLKISERLVWNTINLIHATILQVLDCLWMIQHVKNEKYKIRIDDRHRYIPVQWKRNMKWYFICSQQIRKSKWQIHEKNMMRWCPQSISCILILIICMVRLWANIYPLVVLNKW